MSRPPLLMAVAGYLLCVGGALLVASAGLALGALLNTAPELSGPASWVFASLSVALAAVAVLHLAAGLGLWRRRRWAQYVGGIACGIGIAFGVSLSVSNSSAGLREVGLYATVAAAYALCLIGIWFTRKQVQRT